MASKFKIEDILYPLFVEDPSVFLSVPPPPASSNGLPIMLPSSNNPTRNAYYNKNDTNFGSFNMQSWEKQPYQSLPSITNQQQQDQSKVFFFYLFVYKSFIRLIHLVLNSDNKISTTTTTTTK